MIVGMNKKVCKKCQLEKELSEFYVSNAKRNYRGSTCKECISNKRMENREYYKEKSKMWHRINHEKSLEFSRTYQKENKDVLKDKRSNKSEEIKIKNKLYREKNKEKIKSKYLEKMLSRTDDDIQKQKEYGRKYREENKEWILQKEKQKMINDSLFRSMKAVSARIRNSINRNGYKKESRTHEILGCSFDEFKLYLESKFEPWMSWNNYGLYNGELNYGWDIDHIIPNSFAKNEKELIKLNHYTNLQPLCSFINRYVKRDKIV